MYMYRRYNQLIQLQLLDPEQSGNATHYANVSMHYAEILKGYKMITFRGKN